jgi:hypothetical protein
MMGSDITTRYHVRRREFLDEYPESSELIIGIVQDTREISDEDEHAWKCGTVQLEISDGYRWISFHFEMADRDERDNTLRKMKKLAQVINEVREAIESEVESRDARPHVLYLGEAAIA